ncbi:DoxX family protein [Mucilaginibacter sp. RS28]|uniref:DoxX family protein n=1 Tax=Mucilaginibacter straminoryzae TaxID=2932774 RepID=A0A9X1X6B4_9SPHI|nr:DoxX family protein [Mucilaginibacter straminoryzae]MCJ8209449.1 DoxX family protein [Mucilaginibacter straminoryzae]
MKITRLKLFSLCFMFIFYLLAGLNHFIHPDAYLQIIPRYIPLRPIANEVAGAAEIIFAVMLLFRSTRRLGGILIMLMLVAFLPVHIQMLLEAPIKLASFVVTPLIAWVRLLFQPVLILWAWWATKSSD